MLGGRPLDRGAVRGDDVAGALQVGQRGLELGEQRGGLDGDGGVVGQRQQQRDLVRGERPLPPVGRVENADRLVAQAQRYAEDRHQALTRDGGVDDVLEARVSDVVGGGVGRHGRGDQAAQACAERDQHLLEGLRLDALGHPHVGGAAGVVGQRQVGGVAGQQLAGAADDGLEHLLEVAQGGQVGGAGVEGGQLLLATLPPVEQGTDLERRRDRRRESCGVAQLEQPGQLAGRRLAGQQQQQRRRAVAGVGQRLLGRRDGRDRGGGPRRRRAHRAAHARRRREVRTMRHHYHRAARRHVTVRSTRRPARRLSRWRTTRHRCTGRPRAQRPPTAR